jgi:hypothetical protein
MLSNRRLAGLVMLLATASLVLPASAQDRPRFDPEDGVSRAQILAEGYTLRLSDGTEVRLTGVQLAEGRDQDCMVHIPSLQRRIERGLRGGHLQPIGTGAQTVNLQALQDPNTGELWCQGAGSGCRIIIQ